MNQQFQATYEHGVLRLDAPLPLPDNIRVTGLVTSASEGEGTRPALNARDFRRYESDGIIVLTPNELLSSISQGG
jgi:hypothetical protein